MTQENKGQENVLINEDPELERIFLAADQMTGKGIEELIKALSVRVNRTGNVFFEWHAPLPTVNEESEDSQQAK